MTEDVPSGGSPIDASFTIPEFDPFEEVADGGDQVPDAEAVEALVRSFAGEDPEAALSPDERITRLFEAMSARRRVLMGILRFARDPRTPEQLRDRVDEMQLHDFSVYGSADYVRQLDRAGAIRKVDERGVPVEAGYRRVPEVVVGEDGMEYYKPADPPALFWQITPAGAAFLDRDDPMARLERNLQEDAAHAPLYRAVLEFCDVEGGRTAGELSELIDDDPSVQEPRLYAPYFTDRLERCDALVWEGAWRTTDLGREALARGIAAE